MEIAQTRELFAALISQPQMEDRLLMKPPFKFIHDIVVETIKATGFLQSEFTADELDREKANATKQSKVGFITKLKSLVLNDAGDDAEIEELDPLKVVAGREPERTNALLQRLAISAAAANIGRPSKQSRQSGRTSKSKSRDSTSKSKESTSKLKEPKERKSRERAEPVGTPKSRRDKDREIEREKRRLSKASAVTADLSPAPKARRESKERSSTKREDSTKRRASGTKTKKSKERKTDEDEGLGSVTPGMPRTTTVKEKPVASSPTAHHPLSPPPQRESSGGTSKGDDSGIAEDAAGEADSDRLARVATVTRRLNGRGEMMQLEERESESRTPAEEDATLTGSYVPPPPAGPLTRPGTAAGRPQTSAQRPGTSISRPAPPRVKRTKIADLNEETVSVQPAAFDRAAILTEDPTTETIRSEGPTTVISQTSKPADASEFLVDEEDEEGGRAAGFKSAEALGVADVDVADGTHGALVSRIVSNAREIEREAAGVDGLTDGSTADPAERRRLQAEVERAQRALQAVAQSTQPLARTLELVAEDFDVLLREIETARRQRAASERKLVDVRANRNDSQAAHSQLRQLEAELVDVRTQIAKSTASIIENEKRIHSMLSVS